MNVPNPEQTTKKSYFHQKIGELFSYLKYRRTQSQIIQEMIDKKQQRKIDIEKKFNIKLPSYYNQKNVGEALHPNLVMFPSTQANILKAYDEQNNTIFQQQFEKLANTQTFSIILNHLAKFEKLKRELAQAIDKNKKMAQSFEKACQKKYLGLDEKEKSYNAFSDILYLLKTGLYEKAMSKIRKELNHTDSMNFIQIAQFYGCLKNFLDIVSIKSQNIIFKNHPFNLEHYLESRETEKFKKIINQSLINKNRQIAQCIDKIGVTSEQNNFQIQIAKVQSNVLRFALKNLYQKFDDLRTIANTWEKSFDKIRCNEQLDFDLSLLYQKKPKVNDIKYIKTKKINQIDPQLIPKIKNLQGLLRPSKTQDSFNYGQKILDLQAKLAQKISTFIIFNSQANLTRFKPNFALMDIQDFFKKTNMLIDKIIFCLQNLLFENFQNVDTQFYPYKGIDLPSKEVMIDWYFEQIRVQLKNKFKREQQKNCLLIVKLKKNHEKQIAFKQKIQELQKQINIKQAIIQQQKKVKETIELQFLHKQKRMIKQRISIFGQTQINQYFPIWPSQNQNSRNSNEFLRGSFIVEDLADQRFLFQQIGYLGFKPKKARLLYKSDPFNKINPHLYFDQKPNILVIIKTAKSVIGSFVTAAFDSNRQIECYENEKGIIFSLKNKQIYPKIEGKGTIKYEKNYLIIGNSDLRIDFAKRQLALSIGTRKANFDNKGCEAHKILGQQKGVRQVKIEQYEIFTVTFDQKDKEQQEMKPSMPEKKIKVRTQEQFIENQTVGQQIKQKLIKIFDQLESFNGHMQSQNIKRQIKQSKKKLIETIGKIFRTGNKKIYPQIKMFDLILQYLNDLKQSIEQIEKNHENMVREIKEIKETADQENRRLQKEVKSHQQKLQSKQLQICNLKKLKEQKKHQFERLSGQLEDKRRAVNEYKKQVSVLEKERDSLKTQNKNLKSKNFKEQSATQRLFTLNDQQKKRIKQLENIIRLNLQNQNSYKYAKFFVGEIMDFQNQAKKAWLVNNIQKKNQKSFKRTKLLYRFDKFNKQNFHVYIDNHPHVVLLVKTQNNRVIGAYMKGGFALNQHSNEYEMIFTLTKKQIFERKPSCNFKLSTYDQFYIVIGNNQIRIKAMEDKVHSSFDTINGFYETKGKTVGFLLGKGDDVRQEKIVAYQLYSIEFQQEFNQSDQIEIQVNQSKMKRNKIRKMNQFRQIEQSRVEIKIQQINTDQQDDQLKKT